MFPYCIHIDIYLNFSFVNNTSTSNLISLLIYPFNEINNCQLEGNCYVITFFSSVLRPLIQEQSLEEICFVMKIHFKQAIIYIYIIIQRYTQINGKFEFIFFTLRNSDDRNFY